jgi:hypothetical protein
MYILYKKNIALWSSKGVFFKNTGHIEWRAGLFDTILKENQTRTFTTKSGFNFAQWLQRRRFKYEKFMM